MEGLLARSKCLEDTIDSLSHETHHTPRKTDLAHNTLQGERGNITVATLHEAQKSIKRGSYIMFVVPTCCDMCILASWVMEGHYTKFTHMIFVKIAHGGVKLHIMGELGGDMKSQNM